MNQRLRMGVRFHSRVLYSSTVSEVEAVLVGLVGDVGDVTLGFESGLGAFPGGFRNGCHPLGVRLARSADGVHGRLPVLSGTGDGFWAETRFQVKVSSEGEIQMRARVCNRMHRQNGF